MGCSCTAEQTCAPIRRVGWRVPDDGSSTDVQQIKGPPEAGLLGWELSLAVSTLGHNAQLEMQLDLGGPWDGAAQLVVAGARLLRGGRIYVPWPRFGLSVVNTNPGAESVIQLYASPYLGGRPPLGTSILYGQDRDTVAALGTEAFAIPLGATEYRVMPGESGVGSLLHVQAVSGGIAWEAYDIDLTKGVAPGADPSGGWRRCPPISSSAEIRVESTDPVDAFDLVVLWRYDLGDCQ